MHAAAVRRGAANTFVLGCMPYQSYHTVERALCNATRFMQEAGCDAVKPQGGRSQAHILKALVDAGIPTASHIGLTPHTIAVFGGFRIQGRTAAAAMKILEDALAIQDAGCFMLEFEAVPAAIAKVISEQLEIPTIGIGAGAGTDGQILLSYDLLGVFTDFKPKFTKRYANLTEVAVAGLSKYVEEVKSGALPGRRPQLRHRPEGVRDLLATRREAQARMNRTPTAPRTRASAVLRSPRSGITRKPAKKVAKAAPARSGNVMPLLRTSEPSLTDQAYATLEEMIVTLKLPPGAAVSEAGLSQALGIGRTPIREALQRLARERLVTILPRRGIIVSEINIKSQLRLLEVRREVERLVVRSAARRATPDERARFAELARIFEKSGRGNDETTFIRADREFNRSMHEERAQRIRCRRDDADAFAVAPVLVHPLQAGG